LLKTYIDKAKAEKGVSFLGRLGTYRYLDMDDTIAEGLFASKQTLLAIEHQTTIPVFFADS